MLAFCFEDTQELGGLDQIKILIKLEIKTDE